MSADQPVSSNNLNIVFMEKNYIIILNAGPKHRQRFLCEVRVEGFSYVGAGNSTNKKDAQANAAKDFVNYLVRQALVNAKDVPIDLGTTGAGTVPGKISNCLVLLKN